MLVDDARAAGDPWSSRAARRAGAIGAVAPERAPVVDPWAVPGSKVLRAGTHRAAPIEETADLARRAARAVGVVRFADITGLDRLEVPVVLAVRPNGGWLAVDAGKGLTLEAATVSAAMESVERAVAEAARPPMFDASWSTLATRDLAAPVADLGLARASLFSPGAEQRWTWVWDVAGERPLAVPAALVGAQPVRRGIHVDPIGTDRLDFQVSSNGLASGNLLVEAMCSGLHEVIERDAVACWQRSVARGGHYRRVDPTTVPVGPVATLLTHLDDRGIDPVVLDVTSDIGVPTYLAYLLDRDGRGRGFFRGYGTHLDPEVAMARAITEAAQCRAIIIAGSRDDFFWADHRQARAADLEARYERWRDLEPSVSATAHRDGSTATLAGDLRVLLDRLAAAGLRRVGVLDLTDGALGVPVVRVFVPGLEGYQTSYYAPGRRALGFTPPA